MLDASPLALNDTAPAWTQAGAVLVYAQALRALIDDDLLDVDRVTRSDIEAAVIGAGRQSAR